MLCFGKLFTETTCYLVARSQGDNFAGNIRNSRFIFSEELTCISKHGCLGPAQNTGKPVDNDMFNSLHKQLE